MINSKIVILVIFIEFFNRSEVLMIVLVVFVNICFIIGIKFFVINFVVWIVILLVIVEVVFWMDSIFKKIVRNILSMLMFIFFNSCVSCVILCLFEIVFIMLSSVERKSSGIIMYWISKLFVFIKNKIIGWKKVVDIIFFDDVIKVSSSGIRVKMNLVMVLIVFVV